MTDPIATMQDRFQAMQQAHRAVPNPGYATRKDRLNRLEAGLLRFADRLMTAMTQDFSHRSPSEAGTFDVTIPLGDIRMNRRHLRRWMRARRYHMPKHLLPARGRVLPAAERGGGGDLAVELPGLSGDRPDGGGSGGGQSGDGQTL